MGKAPNSDEVRYVQGAMALGMRPLIQNFLCKVRAEVLRSLKLKLLLDEVICAPLRHIWGWLLVKPHSSP